MSTGRPTPSRSSVTTIGNGRLPPCIAAAFLYDAATDEMTLWISARGTDGQWHMGYARLQYASLLSSLQRDVPVGTPSPVRFKAAATCRGQEP